MAPRKRTCLSTGRPESERCTACANPRLKGKCTFAGDLREMELPETRHEAVGPVRQWEVVDAVDFVCSDDCDDEVAAGMPCSTSTSLYGSDAKRERRAPQVFRPDEFWRRAIPAVASSTLAHKSCAQVRLWLQGRRRSSTRARQAFKTVSFIRRAW